MNKAELISHLADTVGITKKQAEDSVEAFVNAVVDTLKRGGEVNIAGFGAFSAKTRKGRTGVNPRNPSEAIEIPSMVVPKFKAGRGLKEALKVLPPSTNGATPAPTPAPSAPTAPDSTPVA